MGATAVVITDNAAIREELSHTLQDEGFRVWVAASGAQALDLLADTSRHPCAVVVDFTTDGVDSARIVGALRDGDLILTIAVSVTPDGHKEPIGIDELCDAARLYLDAGAAGVAERGAELRTSWLRAVPQVPERRNGHLRANDETPPDGYRHR